MGRTHVPGLGEKEQKGRALTAHAANSMLNSPTRLLLALLFSIPW